MRVIVTKFHGPTNRRGSRVSASDPGTGRRKYFDWAHNLNPEENHKHAAEDFAKQIEWDGDWTGGDTGTGMVWVRSDGYSMFTVMR